MKHSEIYDKHSDNRKSAKGPQKKFKAPIDREARLQRVSFRNYVSDVKNNLDDEASDDIWVVESGTTIEGEIDWHEIGSFTSEEEADAFAAEAADNDDIGDEFRVRKE